MRSRIAHIHHSQSRDERRSGSRSDVRSKLRKNEAFSRRPKRLRAVCHSRSRRADNSGTAKSASCSSGGPTSTCGRGNPGNDVAKTVSSAASSTAPGRCFSSASDFVHPGETHRRTDNADHVGRDFHAGVARLASERLSDGMAIRRERAAVPGRGRKPFGDPARRGHGVRSAVSRGVLGGAPCLPSPSASWPHACGLLTQASQRRSMRRLARGSPQGARSTPAKRSLANLRSRRPRAR